MIQRKRWSGGVVAIAAGLLLIAANGCRQTEKMFKVTSFPSGATIHVEGESLGQTDMERLKVSFISKRLVTLRLAKEGFQPTGIVLSAESPEELAFFLQEAPTNQQVIKTLQDIRTSLDRLPGMISEAIKK